jgi:polyisoprenoid-binding protein YceI
MKKMFLPLLMAAMLLAGTACDRKPKADEAEVSEAQKVADISQADSALKIDTAQSRMHWEGAKVTGRHPGAIDIKEGTIHLKDGAVAGGKIIFDMRTLRPRDKSQSPGEHDKLTSHLRSDDFFDVENYPEAIFEIVSVTPSASADTTVNMNPESTAPQDRYNKNRFLEATHTITGNLTLKNVTKSITFPAMINASTETVTAKANFNIDRTDWKLNYGADRSLGNKLIYSVVNVGFEIVARP